MLGFVCQLVSHTVVADALLQQRTPFVVSAEAIKGNRYTHRPNARSVQLLPLKACVILPEMCIAVSCVPHPLGCYACLCMTQSQAEPTGLAWRHVTGWLLPPVTGGSRPLQPVSVSMHREGKRGELAGLGLWKGLCGDRAWCSCHRTPCLPPPPPLEPTHTLCPPRLLCCSFSSWCAVPRGQASAGDIGRAVLLAT